MTNETTASQPKSIGDDAQFMRLLTDVETSQRWTKQMSDASAKLITYLNSRAPAAQASATIQAAPDALTTLCDRLMAMKRRLRHIPDSGQRESYLVADDVYCYVEEARRAATIQEPVMVAEPVEMILHCPTCHMQHVDAPDERTADWTNPPHRSHLCHACGCIWRPADVPTSGVAAIKTSGKADTAMPAVELNGGMHASIFAKVWGDAGGGDAGRIALAKYAFNLGRSAAAPMVADPAGVAVKRLRELAAGRITGEIPAFEYSIAADRITELESTLAATVKAVPSEALSGAARDVLAERRRQVDAEGWTPEHDDKYRHCELARAAASYAVCSHPDQLSLAGARLWPFHIEWFKRSTYRRDLIKSGALILAEIERIDRAAPLADKTVGGE